HHLAGRHKEAIGLLERAAGLIAPIAEQDSVTQFAASIIPRIYGYLAGAYQHYGRFLNADRWAQRAVEFGVAHTVLFAQALGLEYLGENAIYSGDFVAGLEYAERERRLLRRFILASAGDGPTSSQLNARFTVAIWSGRNGNL